MLNQKVAMHREWLQFSGHIRLPVGGLWSFSLSSDDSSLLYIDGALFINNDGTQLRSGVGCLSSCDCRFNMAEAAVVGLVCCRATYGRQGKVSPTLCLSHVLCARSQAVFSSTLSSAAVPAMHNACTFSHA